MDKNVKNILEELLKKRESNILMLSQWSDEDIEEMINRYRQAKGIAFEENKFESYKILEEKLSQVYDAKNLKFSYSDEASEWVHW